MRRIEDLKRGLVFDQDKVFDILGNFYYSTQVFRMDPSSIEIIRPFVYEGYLRQITENI